MLESKKCAVGLKKNGVCVIPHVPGVTQSVQCDRPALEFEKYTNFDHQVLPVGEKHRYLIQMLYEDLKAWESAGESL